MTPQPVILTASDDVFQWVDTFTGLTYLFNVTDALRIARREIGAAGLLVHPVEPLAQMIDDGMIEIDPAKTAALTINDLRRALVAVIHPDVDGADILIDGWHRVDLARRSNVRDMFIWILNADQTERVRLWTYATGSAG